MKVYALDKDTIEILCEGETVHISTEDEIRFKESYSKFEKGEVLTVEPIKDFDEIQLKCKKDNARIREHAILEIVCNDIIEIIKK